MIKTPKVSCKPELAGLKQIIESCLQFEKDKRPTIIEVSAQIKESVAKMGNGVSYWEFLNNFLGCNVKFTMVDGQNVWLSYD